MSLPPPCLSAWPSRMRKSQWWRVSLPRPPPRSLLPLPVEILHHAIWTQEHRGAQSPTAALENTRDKGSSLSPPLSLTLLLSPAALSSPLKSLCHSSSKILVVPVRDLCRPWQLCAHSLSPEPCTALCKGLSGDQTTRRGLGSHSPLEDPTAKSIPMSQTGHSTPNQASLSSPANLGLIPPGATVGTDPPGGFPCTGDNARHRGGGLGLPGPRRRTLRA